MSRVEFSTIFVGTALRATYEVAPIVRTCIVRVHAVAGGNTGTRERAGAGVTLRTEAVTGPDALPWRLVPVIVADPVATVACRISVIEVSAFAPSVGRPPPLLQALRRAAAARTAPSKRRDAGIRRFSHGGHRQNPRGLTSTRL